MAMAHDNTGCSRILEYRPPRIAMLFLLIATALHWLTPLSALQLPSSKRAASALAVLGFGVMMFAWWQFRQRRVAICPTAATNELITDGVYRYTRNPMYLGIVLMLLAVMLWTGSLPYLIAAGAYFLVIDFAFCPYEEQKLSRDLGDMYRDYAAKVRRWF